MSAKKPVTTTEWVTVAMAEAWLATMAHNRTLREDRVFQYARDMESGNWRLTGQTIKFDTDGRLIDGQHRLTALTLVRKPVEMEVTRGVDPSSLPVIDEGASRTMADVLGFNGREYSQKLAPALVNVWRLLSGHAFSVHRRPSRRELTTLDHVASSDLIKRLKECHQFGESRDNYIAPTILAPVVYIASLFRPAMADEFMHGCVNWRTLPDGHPCVALQKRFINAKLGRHKFTSQLKMAAIIRAWNAFASGESRRRIEATKGRDGETSWPEMKGLNRVDVGMRLCPEVFKVYKVDGIAAHISHGASLARKRNVRARNIREGMTADGAPRKQPPRPVKAPARAARA